MTTAAKTAVAKNRKSLTSPAGNKKSAILGIATEVFLERGYEGASINEMCRRSSISKETFYRHFKNKEALFAAVIDAELDSFWEALNPLDFIYDEMRMEDVLVRAGASMARELSSSSTLALRRVIFHESATKPEIGQLYYSHGPERTYTLLEQYFESQKEKGYKPTLDSRTLSEYFVALLLHKQTLIHMCSVDARSTADDIESIVQEIVKDFMRAFFETVPRSPL